MVKVRKLENCKRVHLLCPNCHFEHEYDRPHIDSSHKYVSPIAGEVFVCRSCDTPIEVTTPFVYGVNVN